MKMQDTKVPYLKYGRQGRAWRVIDTTDGRNAAVGPVYPTRQELLEDFDRYAAESWGEATVPTVKVATLEAPDFSTTWSIETDLTDRWGDLNGAFPQHKPSLRQLTTDDALRERLVGQMWDELTFVTRKDTRWGLLFESEFISVESEEGVMDYEEELRPQTEMNAQIMGFIATAAPRYPGVEFCIPDPEMVVSNRPALWAFVPDGLLDAAKREELGMAILRLQFGDLPLAQAA